MTDPLSTSQLCALVPGLTARRLGHWIDAGHLNPTTRADGTGSGFALAWPPLECRVAADILTLTLAGLTVQAAAHIARRGQEHGAYLAELAGDVFVCYRPTAVPPDGRVSG